MIDVLVYRLLQEDHHEAISKRRNDLKWAANCLKREDSEYYKILDVILVYDAQHGQCPPNKKAIDEFAKTSEDHALRMEWSETIRAALKDLNDIDETRRKAITDVNTNPTSENAVEKNVHQHPHQYINHHIVIPIDVTVQARGCVPLACLALWAGAQPVGCRRRAGHHTLVA